MSDPIPDPPHPASSHSNITFNSNTTESSPLNIHAVDILCHSAFIPVGVFGFYFLVSLQLLIINSLISNLQPFLNSHWPDRPSLNPFCCFRRSSGSATDSTVSRSKTFLGVVGDGVLLVYSVFMLAQHYKVVQQCWDFKLWVHYVVVVLLASLCTCVASFLSFASFLPVRVVNPEAYAEIKEDGEEQRLRPNWIRRIEIMLLIAALFLHCVVGIYFFARKTVIKGVLSDMSLKEIVDPYVHNKGYQATLVSLAPCIGLFVVGGLILFFCGVLGKVMFMQTQIIGWISRLGRPSVMIPIACFVYAVVLMFLGPSYVLMGRIVEDPWGMVFLKTVLGKINAFMTAVFPVLHGLLMFL